MSELISAHSNPTVKLIRSLRQKKGREESGLFIAEGIFHCGEAIEANWEIEMLVVAPDLLTSKFAHQLLEKAARRNIRIVQVSADVFSKLAEKENPQGILTIARQRLLNPNDLTPENFPWGAACVSPQDPGNIGTILRTLDAVGAAGLFLLEGGADPFHPSAVRASMGAIFWKPVVQTTFDEFTHWCQKHGYLLIGSSAHANQDYREYQRGGQPAILLLGSEQKGLSAEHLAACKIKLSLPMRGRVSSLNLAVAAGILLYQMEFGARKTAI
jgi:TrmH family RNA methyltransferase